MYVRMVGDEEIADKVSESVCQSPLPRRFSAKEMVRSAWAERRSFREVVSVADRPIRISPGPARVRCLVHMWSWGLLG